VLGVATTAVDLHALLCNRFRVLVRIDAVAAIDRLHQYGGLVKSR
jgi:hypothetical protein